MSDMKRTITPNDPADFTPTREPQIPLQPFRYWCQKVLPLVYDDSLSYYELLCKVVDYLNKTMEDVTNMDTDMSNLYTAYGQLQDYVNNYFSTLDVQEEINKKLDELVNSGRLDVMLNTFIPYSTPEMYGCVGDGKTDDYENLQKAINDCAKKRRKLVLGKVYLISKGLTIPENSSITGKGAYLTSIINNSNDYAMTLLYGSVQLENIRITGGSGIQVGTTERVSGSIIKNILMTFVDTAIFIKSATGYNVFEDIYIRDNGNSDVIIIGDPSTPSPNVNYVWFNRISLEPDGHGHDYSNEHSGIKLFSGYYLFFNNIDIVGYKYGLNMSGAKLNTQNTFENTVFYDCYNPIYCNNIITNVNTVNINGKLIYNNEPVDVTAVTLLSDNFYYGNLNFNLAIIKTKSPSNANFFRIQNTIKGKLDIYSNYTFEPLVSGTINLPTNKVGLIAEFLHIEGTTDAYGNISSNSANKYSECYVLSNYPNADAQYHIIVQGFYLGIPSIRFIDTNGEVMRNTDVNVDIMIVGKSLEQ